MKEHVKISIETYEKLRAKERDFDSVVKESNDKVNQATADIVKFVFNSASSNLLSDIQIHELADSIGFKIKYEKNNVMSTIGKTGSRVYNIKE